MLGNFNLSYFFQMFVSYNVLFPCYITNMELVNVDPSYQPCATLAVKVY